MFDPIGDTNALHPENSVPQSPTEPLKGARIHRVIRTILNGPDYIIVHRTKKDYERLCGFDLALKIMRGPIMPLQESWALYTTGNRIPGVVLRYARVERQALYSAKANKTLPEIIQHTRYVARQLVRPLLRDCEVLDGILSAGNLLQPLSEGVNAADWQINTLYRAMDVGSIELNWNATAQGPALEAQMHIMTARMSKILNKHAQKHPERIEHMDFVYNNPEPDAINILQQVNPPAEIQVPK